MAYEREIQWLKKNQKALQNLFVGLRVKMVCLYLEREELEKAEKNGGQLIIGMLAIEDEDSRLEFLEAQLEAKERQKKKGEKHARERKGIAKRRKKRKARGLPPEPEPYPPLTHYVPQARYHTRVNSLALKFGTRGCGTCVGVVAKMLQNKIFCCHLDHDIVVNEPRNFAMRTRWHDFKESLLTRLPKPSDVLQISMTTSSPNWVSKRTWEALKMIYGRKYIGPAKWQEGGAEEETMMQPTYTAIWWNRGGNSIERSDETGMYLGEQVGDEVGSIVLVGEHLVLRNDDTVDIEERLRSGTYKPR
jgi:hypothetical protein